MLRFRSSKVFRRAIAAGALLLGALYLAGFGSGGEEAQVSPRRIARRLLARGVVVAAHGTAHVYPRADGIVARVLVRPGDRVKMGQVLAELDVPTLVFEHRRREAEHAAAAASAELLAEGPENLRREEAAAEESAAAASLMAAHDRAGRLRELARNGAVSAAELQQAEAQDQEARARWDAAHAHRELLANGTRRSELRAALKRAEAARAAMEIARLEAGWQQMVAPIDGVVLSRSVDPGDTVVAGRVGAPPLFELADASAPLLRAEVNEIDAGSLHAGQEVIVYGEKQQRVLGQGTIARIADRIEPSTIDASEKVSSMVRVVWVDVNWQHDAAVLLGQRMVIAIALPALDAATAVPRRAVSVADGRATVSARRGPLWRRAPVALGAGDDEWVEIAGLPAGTVVRLQPQ